MIILLKISIFVHFPNCTQTPFPNNSTRTPLANSDIIQRRAHSTSAFWCKQTTARTLKNSHKMAEPDSRKTDEPDLVMEFEVEQDHPEDGGSSSSDDSEYSDEDQGRIRRGIGRRGR